MSTTIAGDLLRTSDFPNGIANASDVARLGALLNPRLKKLQSLSSQGVNIASNLDGQIVTFQVVTPSTPWIAPTLLNSWANYGTWAGAGFMRDGVGFVHLHGLVKSGTTGTICQLPGGFRPALPIIFSAQTNPGGAVARLDVNADGTVVAGAGYSNVWLSLDGVSFLAEDAAGSPGILSCFPQQIRIQDRRRPIAVWLLSCQDHSQANPAGTANSGATTPSIMVPGFQWSYVAASQAGQPNLVSIDGMPGLALGRTYDVSVLVVYA